MKASLHLTVSSIKTHGPVFDLHAYEKNTFQAALQE